MLENIQTKGINLWVSVIITITYAVTKLLIAAILLLIFDCTLKYNLPVEIGEMFSVLIFLIIIILFIKKNCFKKTIEEKHPLLSIDLLFITVILTICFRVFSDPTYRFSEIIHGLYSEEVYSNPEISFDLLIYAIRIIFLQSLFEELLFRKILFQQLLIRYSNLLTAILISSILFALTHLGFDSLLPNFLFGCFAAYIFYLSRSIIYPILFHIISNGIWLYIHLNTEKYREILAYLNFSTLYWVIILLSVLLAIFCFIYLKRRDSSLE